MTRRVAIVPHTHWDREWYEPFPRFRLRLVELVDDLLPLLERDEQFAHFLLDGQLAAVDDHLAARPEDADRMRRLVEDGRLAIGPWYTLPDEFLVSGETLVRDLQLGFERATELGGAMEVGYLPDMFGHVAQMPQLLRQFGLDQAVLWRGVPAAIDRTAFWWEAPDGSRVRAEYLPQGYGNGANLPDDAADLLARVEAWEAEFAPLLDDGPILVMNGSDHLLPQPELPGVVAKANELAGDRYAIAMTSLVAYLAEAPVGPLPAWRGELRSGARANLLMGVASNRVDVKQAAARAERALERRAEPMLALFAPPGAWPQRLLDEAWRDVVRNAAHDSICACSVDQVVDAVRHRFAEAATVAEDLADRAVRFVGAQVAVTGPVVVNPSARTRSGLVELEVAGHEVPAGAQALQVRPARLLLADLPPAAAPATAADIASWTQGVTGVAVEQSEVDVAADVVLLADGTPGDAPGRASVRSHIEALLAEAPARRIRLWLQRPPASLVLVHAEAVPGFGWKAWRPGPPDVEPVSVDGHAMANGLVRVDVSGEDGTFAIDGVPGFGRLVDGGDAGDTYNWCPPRHDRLVARPAQVELVVEEAGPLRARLRVDATYRWPHHVDDTTGRRIGAVDVPVSTRIELCAGERLVRLAIDVDNRAEDHRLRLHVPLIPPASVSRAECAFALVERGLVAEGGPTEAGVPTFPSRRFVQAGEVTVVHDGLLEYELVDVDGAVAHGLALTLLRATRLLSRGPMLTRPLPAGPVIEVPGAQVPGRHRLRCAVAVGRDLDPFALADEGFLPLEVTTGGALGDAPGEHQALTVAGAEVSSLRRREGRLELRVFNPRPDETVVRVPGRHGWLADLRGRRQQPFADAFSLRPWGIATALLS